MARTTFARVAFAVAAAVTMTLGLAACDPGDDPTDSPTDGTASETTTSEDPTTDESTSEDPTSAAPTPPDLDQPTPPEELRVDDRAGAAAAAEYYIELLGYAQATGDQRQLEAMSSPDCSYCGALIEDIEDVYAAGGWIETPGFTVGDVRVQFYEDGYLVRLPLESPAGTVHDGDGGETPIDAERLPNFALALIFTDGAFTVTDGSRDTDA